MQLYHNCYCYTPHLLASTSIRYRKIMAALRINRLLQAVLLTACILLSHAYSKSPTPRHNSIDQKAVVPATTNNPMARRAFFERGTAAAAAATLTSITIAAAAPKPAHAASSPVPALGSPAPEFSLVNTKGKTITLDSLATSSSSDTTKNKWTVLYFYPGAFTSGCTLEARRFQEDLPLFQKANAQIVGVSVDSVEKNAEFCTSEGLDFFMLTDTGGKVSKAYGSSLSIPLVGTFSNRQTYIIDPQKNLRWVFVDVESRIPRHSGDVLEKLKELQQQQV